MIFTETVFLWQWWSGSEIHLYVIDEDLEKFKTESKVLIINHSYEIDWLVMFSLYETTGQLGGVKDFTKAENRWIPIAGWIMFFAEWIGLRRNFKSDKKVIEHGVREVFSFPFTVSLNYYAEGTRFTKSKHKNSVEFAQKRGLTPLQNLLIPRTKGFTTFLPIIKTTSEALYDVIIAFKENEGANPIIMNVLNGQKMIAHVYLKRIPLTEIPDNEIEASLWLQSLYREKDFKITKFKKNGNFGKVNQILTKSFHVLICEVITFLVLYSGILWILIYTILQGNFTLLSVVITIFGLRMFNDL